MFRGSFPTVESQVGDGAPDQSSEPGSGWQLLNLFSLLLAEIHLLQVKPRGWCGAERVGWVPPPFSAVGGKSRFSQFIWDSSVAPWVLEQQV